MPKERRLANGRTSVRYQAGNLVGVGCEGALVAGLTAASFE